MRKILAALLLLALLTGCAAPVPTEPSTAPTITTTEPTILSTEPPTEPTQEPTAEPTEPPEADPSAVHLQKDLPKMDGSTSLIPLEAGIRAAIFGKTIEDATLDVHHSTTWESFRRLITGEVELAFSCPISQEQYGMAEQADFEIKAVPIAMEGFVFAVNADNPVDSLTQEELKGIYSGQITNWAQVGGPDLPIIPYQRNNDSGSQNFMIAFMGDTPLMDAPTELRPTSMARLLDVVALNDNSLGAIGYSVYAYAADMYGNGNEIKFIKVDGVAPSRQTFASGEYPLLGTNYALYSASEPADGNVQQLVDWLLTDNGQLAIAKAGYVTIRDIGFRYEEEAPQVWQGTGTGPAADIRSYEYRLYYNYNLNFGGSSAHGTGNFLPVEQIEFPDGRCSFRVRGLTNPGLAYEVHSFIDEASIALWAQQQALEGRLQRTYEGLGGTYSFRNGKQVGCLATVTNGYLSVAVLLDGWCAETATWDLFTGKRLATEDLFCQGVDIDQVLLEFLRVYFDGIYDDFFQVHWDLKQDVSSLPMTGWHVTHDAIYLDYGNPIFHNCIRISLASLPDGTLAAQNPRDFSAYIRGSDLTVSKVFRTYYGGDAVRVDERVYYSILDETLSPYAASINAQAGSHIQEHFSEKAIQKYYSDQGLPDHYPYLTGMDWPQWALVNYGNLYAVFSGPQINHTGADGNSQTAYPYDRILIFNITTGERVQWQDLLLPGWENASACEPADPPPWDELQLTGLTPSGGGGLLLNLNKKNGERGVVRIEVPAEFVNYGD